MTSILLSESVTKVFNALVSYIEKFSNFMTLEYLLYGSVGLLVLTLLITWIRTSFTYEAKLLSKTKKLNKYLAKKQNIDENNLIEFNDKMKQVPKVVRHNWQEYMLNRDKPSKYINCDNCIDIPTRISSYQTSIRICKIFISIICGLTFIFGLGNFYSITGRSAYAVFFQVLIVPVLLFVLGMLFISFLSARHTAIMADLYYNFQQFEKNLDRACKTMPEVIDYEVLFTKKEIKEQLLCWLIRFSKIYGVSLALLDKKGNKTIFFGEKDLHQEKCLEQIRKDIEKGIYKQTANMIFPIEKGVCHYGFIVVLYRKEMKFSSETVIAGAKLLSDIIFDIYERRL